MIQFDEQLFQMCWNHHLEKHVGFMFRFSWPMFFFSSWGSPSSLKLNSLKFRGCESNDLGFSF